MLLRNRATKALPKGGRAENHIRNSDLGADVKMRRDCPLKGEKEPPFGERDQKDPRRVGWGLAENPSCPSGWAMPLRAHAKSPRTADLPWKAPEIGFANYC